MNQFKHSLARIAIWNLAGFNQPNPVAGISPSSNRAKNQAERLALLDAELFTLVEVSPVGHIARLAQLLNDEYDLPNDHTFVPQQHGPPIFH